MDSLVLTTPPELRALLADALGDAVGALRDASPPTAAPDRPALGYVSNREAARQLGVSKSTLARWRADRLLPYSKIGERVFYAVEDVRALMAGRRVAA